jgi:hypothetical protein
MTEIVCIDCGHFVPASGDGAAGELMSVTCEACGAEISYRVGNPAATARLVRGGAARSPATTPGAAGAGGPPTEPGPPSTPSGSSGFSTILQPRPLAPDAERDPPSGEPAGGRTVLLGGQPAPPPLPRGQGGYFLVLGAAPAAERLPLRSARTVFGRGEADVDLDDASVSAHHFQVEVAGAEVYIRDLKSRNGTFVNGRRIRYAELRPGDEVLAGSTYLVYRGWNDGPIGAGRGAENL